MVGAQYGANVKSAAIWSVLDHLLVVVAMLLLLDRHGECAYEVRDG